MPNVFGFDELPDRGNYRRRCIWCGEPGTSEAQMRRHQRKHAKELAAADAASKRERETAQTAIVV